MIADALAEVRIWLDHNDCVPLNFDIRRLSTGAIRIRVEFADDALAEAFEREFAAKLFAPLVSVRVHLTIESFSAGHCLALDFEFEPERDRPIVGIATKRVGLEPLRIQPFPNGRHHLGQVLTITPDLDHVQHRRGVLPAF